LKNVNLKGRTAFITGASEGMGKACSLYLSKLGVNVILAARRRELVEDLAKRIQKEFGTDPLGIKVDVTKESDVKDAIHLAKEKYGRIDFGGCFAGNPVGYVEGDRKKAIYEQNIEHLKEIAEVDHFGTIRVLKYLLPIMIRQRFGKIIVISAITSVYGYSEDVDYIPYKRANEGIALSTALRSEREKWGVELYTLAPGDVYNPSTWNSYDEKERIEAVRYGVIESSTVAKIVSWLFSGTMGKKYEMRVDLDKGVVLRKGKYSVIANGDIIVIDARTVPKLFESVGQRYGQFVPPGYEWVK
jgi:NADP-dependent 3-hydroxy acid dehydrogenase YdfG